MTVQKWEYLEVTRVMRTGVAGAANGQSTATGTGNNPEWITYIAQLGDQGWELVAVTDNYSYIFKRPK